MMKKRYLVALGVLSGALAACGSNISGQGGGDDDSSSSSGGTPGKGGTGASSSGGNSASGGSGNGTSGGSSGQTSGGTSGTGAGGTSGSSGSSGSGGTGAVTCTPGVPTSSQIPRMLNRQYDAVVRDLLGVTTVGTDNTAPSAQLFADFQGPMTADAWRIYQDIASQIAHQVMTGPNKSKFISCDPAAKDCLKTTIQTFGAKAFRRPLTDAEVSRFLNLANTTPAGAPADVAETTLMAFLVSPSFLLIPEVSTAAMENGAYKLSSYEVASRLSFLLWGTVPDDTLTQAAAADQLQTKEQILAQAQRMIMQRDKAGPLISAFHRNYLQMDSGAGHWWKIDHDTTKFPAYNTATAKTSYSNELDQFFQEVAYGGGSFKDLFLSNIGFVNKDNAAIYGLDPSKYGTDLQKVTLDSNQRPGFMTRAGFLSSYSHFGDTSPILRGAFITVYMLGVDPGPPLAGAAQLTAPPADYKTNREYTTALTSQADACKGCHNPYINPSGFVLEQYNAIGQWQTTDQLGGPIDPKATVTFSDTDVKDISSPLELMQEIAAQPMARQIYAQNWVSFTTGRSANPNDQCEVDDINTKLSSDGYTVLNLMADLTQADSFRLRVRETP